MRRIMGLGGGSSAAVGVASKVVSAWTLAVLFLLGVAIVVAVAARSEAAVQPLTADVAATATRNAALRPSRQQVVGGEVQPAAVNASPRDESPTTRVAAGSAEGERALALLNDHAAYEDARAVARECLGRDPTDARCNWALLWSFTRQGDWGAELRQAAADCLVALPSDPYCIDIAADIAMRDGNVTKAEQLLDQRPSTNEEEDTQLLFQQALLDEAKGDRAAACSLLSSLCSRGFDPACNDRTCPPTR